MKATPGGTGHRFPLAAAMVLAGVRVDVGTGIAAVVERQTGAVADLVRQVVGEPDALARTHQADHALHHVVMHVAVEDEIPLQPAQRRPRQPERQGPLPRRPSGYPSARSARSTRDSLPAAAQQLGGKVAADRISGRAGASHCKVIDWLKLNFAKPVRVDDLAARVQMSTPTFHQHFRQLTAMSPLQYQKWLRLNEAKRLMLSEHLDASSAAFKVGYESPSQFSREYSRLFGSPPKKDISSLRGLVKEPRDRQ